MEMTSPAGPPKKSKVSRSYIQIRLFVEAKKLRRRLSFCVVQHLKANLLE
jgi:hypothetical protein